MSAAPGVDVHLPVLLSGLRWLYDTEQPGDAVLQHHGERLPSAGNRTVSFVPSGWQGRVVIVVDVTHIEYGPAAASPPQNPLAPDELDAFADLLDCMGEDVVHRWNGHRACTGSLALKRVAHPSLLAAIARYHAGCPQHHSVFCRCGWYGAGYSRVVSLRQIHSARTGIATHTKAVGPRPVDGAVWLYCGHTAAGAVEVLVRYMNGQWESGDIDEPHLWESGWRVEDWPGTYTTCNDIAASLQGNGR